MYIRMILYHISITHILHIHTIYVHTTGEITKSCEGGFKRICLISKDPYTRVYPRVDPVMIACVVSSDFQHCLLG